MNKENEFWRVPPLFAIKAPTKQPSALYVTLFW